MSEPKLCEQCQFNAAESGQRICYSCRALSGERLEALRAMVNAWYELANEWDAEDRLNPDYVIHTTRVIVLRECARKLEAALARITPKEKP